MWEWLTWAIVTIALAQALLSLGWAISGSPPNDYTLGATGLLGLGVFVQIGVTVWSQASGASPQGDIVEFWAYLATAALLAPAAIVWGLIERSRWSTGALALVGFSLAVMVYRMHEIWFVQAA